MNCRNRGLIYGQRYALYPVKEKKEEEDQQWESPAA
jgi:hypothetical protein